MFHLWTRRASDDYVISTTELIDPDYNGYRFETMIYNNKTHEFLHFQERYKNCTQALNGHIHTIRNLDNILFEEQEIYGKDN